MQSKTRKTEDNIRLLFERYIYECTYRRRRSGETIRGYKQVFDTLIKLCPSVTIENLSPKTLTDFFKILQTRERRVGAGTIKRGVKNSTIATYCSKLHSFFEWLVDHGRIMENPVGKMARIRVNYDDAKSLEKLKIDKIRAAIETHSHDLLQRKRDRAILSVLVMCGLRRGELLGLTVTDINLERRILTVRKETSKSNLTRMIPLNFQATIDLEDYLSERKRKLTKQRQPFYHTPQLFVALNEDRGLSKDGLKHWVNRLQELSGVKFHLHQFRHTFATNLGANGNINAMQLQKLLGHTDLRMTQRYVRSLTAEDLRPVTDSLSFDKLA